MTEHDLAGRVILRRELLGEMDHEGMVLHIEGLYSFRAETTIPERGIRQRKRGAGEVRGADSARSSWVTFRKARHTPREGANAAALIAPEVEGLSHPPGLPN